MRHIPALFASLLLAAGVSAAQERAAPSPAQPPDTPEQAAERVFSAFVSGDAEASRALAMKADPDPWLVADELCARDRHDAAEAFARAVPSADVKRLPAYVASRRGRSEDRDARTTLARMNEALARGDEGGAIDAGRGGPAPADSVVGIRIEYGLGLALRAAGREEEVAAALRRAADGARALGWLRRHVEAVQGCAISAWSRGDWPAALAAWQEQLEVNRARGDGAAIAQSLGSLGLVHEQLGEFAKTLECNREALALYERAGDRAGTARALEGMAYGYGGLRDAERAVEHYEKALRIEEELGDRAAAAETLLNLGNFHFAMEQYARAIGCHEKALGLFEELGNRLKVSWMLGNLGASCQGLGEYRRAFGYQEKAIAIMEELGDRAGIARTWFNFGLIRAALGETARARGCQEKALALYREVGDRHGQMQALVCLGVVRMRQGDVGGALDCQEQSLRLADEIHDVLGQSQAWSNIANVHFQLGASERALDDYARLRTLCDAIGYRVGVAVALNGAGNVQRQLGNLAAAQESLEEALRILEEIGDGRGIAGTKSTLGIVHRLSGDLDAAARLQEEALGEERAAGEPERIASALTVLADTLVLRGDAEAALERATESLHLAEQAGIPATEVWALDAIARAHRSAGRFREALDASTRAVERLSLVTANVGDELAAGARATWRGVHDGGVLAACELGDAAAVLRFAEAGRAGALLQALALRDRLGDVAVPVALNEALAEARLDEMSARRRLDLAIRSGDVGAVKTRRVELEAARRAVADAVERIQRLARASADVTYPAPDDLPAIRARLQPSDVLVLYVLTAERGLAVVVRAGGARLVDLGDTEAIEEASGALHADRAAEDPGVAVAMLRERLVAPLGLPEEVTRLLVSPDGFLAYVPFALLDPAREVTYVPSATTYGLLLRDAAKRGEGVLALGDPDYSAPRAEPLTVLRGEGQRLVPLPATGAEARAVGTTVLLGKDATEARLREALGRRPRWRAVHLACHGLIDARQPLFSSLAVTPDARSDGQLTVHEIFEMNVPADLVVLSACETGRGKIVLGEGILGLTRAFMFAGAPRVLVSLWKVDDEATAVLMSRFYRAYSAGVPAATALREAQAEVRSQEKWRHPAYWAAWVLWGLR